MVLRTHEIRWRLRSGALLAPLFQALPARFFRFSEGTQFRSGVALGEIRSVLLVRLDEIGDIVLTTPLLRELRRNMPRAWITLLVKPGVYNLVELCPHVNETLTFDCQGRGVMEPLQRHWRALSLARRSLRSREFELSILPRWDIDWYHGTFLSYLSGAATRVGYSEEVTALKKRFNCGFDKLLTVVIRDSSIKHEVQHNLDVIEFLGGEVRREHLELWLSDDDERFAEEFLRHHEIDSDKLLFALGPGAGSLKRRWPLKSFAEIGAWLENQYHASVIIIGGPDDATMSRELHARLPSALDAAGKTTLRQTVALLRRCSFYIGNDAGPMHLAAAAGIPVVELSCHAKSGSDSSANSPRRFGPWATESIIVQPDSSRAPCIDECSANVAHCILGISVKRVKELLARFLPVLKSPSVPDRVNS
jgi:heptosyltransferase-2